MFANLHDTPVVLQLTVALFGIIYGGEARREHSIRKSLAILVLMFSHPHGNDQESEF